MVKCAFTAVSDTPQDRATSHAKSLDLDGQKTALERARALKEAFDRAKSAQDHSREQERTRQPEPVERPTSHAKMVDLNERESPLDRARALKREFNRTDAVHEQSRAQEKARQSRETDGPSHAPRAEPHLRPEGDIRRAVDRQIDKEKLARDHQRAKELAQAVREREEPHRQRDREDDRDRSRGRSR